MKGRSRTKGHRGTGGTSARDRNIANQKQESTGSDPKMGSAYGMAKGPSQPMAGAAKKAALPSKVKRAAGASYAGASEGSKPKSSGYMG